MVHLDTPGVDVGRFSTDEVRSRTKPAESTSRRIAFFDGQYRNAPRLAAGFCALDLAHETPARANLVADEITDKSFKVTLETWGKSTLYSAGATWIEHKIGARDCQSGQFDTQEAVKGNATFKESKRKAPNENEKKILFAREFKGDCQVVCWLNRIDMVGGESNYRIRAYATNISRQGFTAHIDTWGDSQLNGAAMCWIAFPKNKSFVQTGSFGTGDVRSWSNPRPKNSARVNFEPEAFKTGNAPTVLVALNTLDMAGNSDLRISVDVDEVTDRGFRWHLDTWDDSTLYSAGASWIALGFA